MGSPADFAGMLGLFSEGKLKPAVDDVVGLEDAAAAAERMNSGLHFGKIVLAIE
jgi:NADPH:quinone reductase-like Zn-dependent oxidoreductase